MDKRTISRKFNAAFGPSNVPKGLLERTKPVVGEFITQMAAKYSMPESGTYYGNYIRISDKGRTYIIKGYVCYGRLGSIVSEFGNDALFYDYPFARLMQKRGLPAQYDTISAPAANYLTWLVNKSPWSPIFMSKDIKQMVQRGYMLDSSRTCFGFVIQAAMAARAAVKYSGRIALWNLIVENRWLSPVNALAFVSRYITTDQIPYTLSPGFQVVTRAVDDTGWMLGRAALFVNDIAAIDGYAYETVRGKGDGNYAPIYAVWQGKQQGNVNLFAPYINRDEQNNIQDLVSFEKIGLRGYSYISEANLPELIKRFALENNMQHGVK